MEPNELPSYFHYYNILFSQNEIITDGFYIHMKGTGNDYFSKLKAPLWGNVSKAWLKRISICPGYRFWRDFVSKCTALKRIENWLIKWIFNERNYKWFKELDLNIWFLLKLIAKFWKKLKLIVLRKLLHTCIYFIWFAMLALSAAIFLVSSLP